MRQPTSTPSVLSVPSVPSVRSGPLALTVAGCLLATACAGGSGGGSAGGAGGQGRYVENGTFTMSVGDDLGGFDPYQSNIIKSYYKLAYDSMINIRPDGRLVAGLANKWSANATSATFTLRPDVTCSDGTRLTAGQVAADLAYAANPKNKSSLYGSQVPSTPFTTTGDDATGTVNITMSKPYGFILHTIGLFPVMCAKGMRDRSILKTSSDGTGPFVLTKVVPGQSYTFTVRKGYKWGPAGATTDAPGTPRTVVIKIITNETTAANLLLSGEISAASVAGDDQQRLLARGLRKVSMAATGAWLWFNHAARRATADEQVRQALLAALDVPSLIKVNTGGGGGPSTGLAGLEPKACPGDTVAGRLPKHDAAAAGALLDRAGWANGPDGTRTKNGRRLNLDLHFVPAYSSFNKPTAELVAAQWRAVGVNVKLTADTIVGMNETMFQTTNFDVYMQGFGVFLPSAMEKYIDGPVPPAGVNLAAIKNKEYTRLAAKAITMTPPAACAYWNQAEQALWRAADIVPIANRPTLFFLRNAEAQFMGYESPVPTSIRLLDH